MCGCLLPPPRSLSIILERGFSSAPGKAMEMLVQWFPECDSLRMVVFVAFSVCTIGVKLSVHGCHLDAGEMFLVLVRGGIYGVP